MLFCSWPPCFHTLQDHCGNFSSDVFKTQRPKIHPNPEISPKNTHRVYTASRVTEYFWGWRHGDGPCFPKMGHGSEKISSRAVYRHLQDLRCERRLQSNSCQPLTTFVSMPHLWQPRIPFRVQREAVAELLCRLADVVARLEDVSREGFSEIRGEFFRTNFLVNFAGNFLVEFSGPFRERGNRASVIVL